MKKLKVQVKLPMILSYSEWVSFYPKGIEGVYKITFEDGFFYIGQTGNFYSRIWNHVTLSDLNIKSRPTDKHIRMNKAIKKKEKVFFELINNESDKEREIIKRYIKDKLCLNMKI